MFVGGSLSEYETHLSRDSDTIPIHQTTGNENILPPSRVSITDLVPITLGCAQAMQSNRLSHFFDLRGPSFTLDTACSSSLTTLHVACQSLRAGESTAAIVGGCHLNLLPESFISFSSSRYVQMIAVLLDSNTLDSSIVYTTCVHFADISIYVDYSLIRADQSLLTREAQALGEARAAASSY